MREEDTPQELPEADAAWFAELADSAVENPDRAIQPAEEPQTDPGGVTYLPPLTRERPVRTPIIPRWVMIGAAATVAAVVVIVGIALILASVRQVTVPDVSGVAVAEARTRLEAVGLVAEITERRFSSELEGTVLAQTPAKGSSLNKGDSVNLVVSAGSEDFPMPDVIGQDVTAATKALEDKGLVVSVETLVSDAASDTVLASTPAPGAQVRTGDRVVLQVAAPTAPGVVLQPYDLTGVAVTVDAAPPAGGSTDISLEVARRLGALLEASGASVTMLRTSADTATTEADRATRAAEATSTLAIGFGLSSSPAPGRVIQSPTQGSAQAIASSALLASAVTSELAAAAPPTSAAASAADPVLSASRVTWVRILLGSQAAREDQTLFTDPNWADKVARAVYSAIGKTYGVVQQP
jgi:hypothetical protein